MSFLDVRTVMLSHVLTDAVCTAVLALLWVQNRKRFAGISYWVLDFAFQTAAVLLIVARGSVPDWLSMSVSNALVVSGAFLGFIGLTRFVGKRTFQIHNYILLAALIALHLYFVFVKPNLAARSLIVSTGLLVISFQCVWFVLRRTEHGMKRMTRWVGLVFGLFCIVSMARVVVILIQVPTNNDFFRSGAYDTLLLMSYQMLLILLTFALTLMINQRLVRDVQTQEEKFAKAFQSSPYAVTLTRPSDGQILDVNDGFVTITGYTHDESVGKTSLDLKLWVRETDRAAVISDLKQGNRVLGREIQFRKKSGERMTGLFSAEIISINDQPCMLASISDITERNRAEEALRESEDKFKDIFESANVGKSITLPTGEIKVNRAFCNLLGYTQEELESKTWQELTPPVDIDFTQKQMDMLLTGRNDSARFTKRFMHKNGSLIWADVSSALRRDGDGKPLHFITTIVDITERKRAEESLAVSEANLLSLLESTDDIIVSRDREGRVIAFNKAFASIIRSFFGVEATPGMDTSDYLTAETKTHWDEVMARVMSGESQHYEYSQEYGGSIHHYELGLTPIRVGGEIVGTAEFTREITARKRVEDQLRQAQKMETVGQLAGGVAHDFNNMLQVITSYVEMSLTKVEAGQPLHKYLLEVRRAAHRSAEITGQLLAFARKQTVSPKVLDLNAALAGTQKMIQRLIGEDIDLAWRPGHDLWNVKIDPAQLDQILANLTVNARDAIDGVGKLMIETRNVSFDEAYCAAHPNVVAGEYVLLAVSDDGSGMDRETMSHLFEPFFTTKGPGKGTGLGLATIYGIVRQNNGFVNAYSEPGQGTTFRVYLPRAKGETVSGPLDADVTALRGGTETVLVVEDEEAILELALESLKQLGYTVLTASSPQEAMRTCREQPGQIHLLITDVVMPQMNGRQLADRLRAERPGLKCLFMSGYTADVIAHRGVLEEGVSFIGKPFSLATLANKVRETLAG